MKIVMIGNSDLCIYAYRRELVERLAADGHHVVVLSPNGKLINELVNMGCEYFEVALDRHGTNPIKDSKLILKYIVSCV